jgi:hypothetical protein
VEHWTLAIPGLDRRYHYHRRIKVSSIAEMNMLDLNHHHVTRPQPL